MSNFKSAFLKGLIWGAGFTLAYGLDWLGLSINGFRCMNILSFFTGTYICARLLYLQIQMIEACRELESF